jgi:hypothetical protein
MTIERFARRLIIKHHPKAEFVAHVNGTFSVVAGKEYTSELLGGGMTKLEALIDAASKLEVPVKESK